MHVKLIEEDKATDPAGNVRNAVAVRAATGSTVIVDGIVFRVYAAEVTEEWFVNGQDVLLARLVTEGNPTACLYMTGLEPPPPGEAGLIFSDVSNSQYVAAAFEDL